MMRERNAPTSREVLRLRDFSRTNRPLTALTPRRWRQRRVRLSWYLVVAAALITGWLGLRWLAATPKIEPAFDQLVIDQPGPVKDFSLLDAAGALHTDADWAGRPAIVLVLIDNPWYPGSPLEVELGRIARRFGPAGVLFLGISAGSDEPADNGSTSETLSGLPFQVLRDPSRRVAAQVCAQSAPAAVVLGADGQIFFRGQFGEPAGGADSSRPKRGIKALESVLDALVADELPVVTSNETSPAPATVDVIGDNHAPSSEVTFNKHVAPLLWRNCVCCHRPGEIGPFSLLAYADAAKRASFLYEVAADRRMPPWKPHSGAGVFLDALRLSSTEIQTLQRWAESGCKQGDPADLPALPRFADGWQLGQPDLVLTAAEPYAIPASGPDIYRSFCLPFPLERDVTIHGVEFRAGNRRVVHHSRMYLDETGDARRRDDGDSTPGFTGWFGSDGRFDLPYPGLGAWTPGMTPRFAPDGVGRVIRRGSDVVLQIHYHPTGKPELDRSSIGLFFARKPTTRTMAGYTLCTDRIDIPAGEKRHKIILSTRIKTDIHLYTVVPHAHHLCREFRLAATLPDGRVQPLLWITDWDMDWQDQYRYARPVRLPEGTIVTLAAYFDNSESNPRNPNKPPLRVRYGVETKDEMCACHLEFLCDQPRGLEIYQQKSPFGL